jgi:hypothetical protein
MTNKPGRKKKSSFYHIRNKVGLNQDRAAEVLGCTIDEVQKFDIEGAPAMAERFLLLWDRKYVGVEGWDGWLFSRGVLVYRGQRWRPRMILESRESNQELSRLRDDLEKLRTWRGLFTVFVEKLVNERKQRRRRRGF